MSEIEFTQESNDKPVINDITEIICIIDRSGSMSSIKSDAIGGFNEFLKSQKENNRNALMTLVQFDNEYDIVYNGVPVESVDEYTDRTYIPRGSTALYDAIGKMISDVDTKRAQSNVIPAKTLVAIITDGYENASREYKMDQIKNLIESRRNNGWEFIFVTAGIDQIIANRVGNNIGIGNTNVLSVGYSGDGMRSGYASMANAALNYSTSGNIGMWKDDDYTFKPSHKKLNRFKKSGGYKTR